AAAEKRAPLVAQRGEGARRRRRSGDPARPAHRGRHRDRRGTWPAGGKDLARRPDGIGIDRGEHHTAGHRALTSAAKEARAIGRGLAALLGIGFVTAAYVYLSLPDVRPLRAQNPDSTAF